MSYPENTFTPTATPRRRHIPFHFPFTTPTTTTTTPTATPRHLFPLPLPPPSTIRTQTTRLAALEKFGNLPSPVQPREPLQARRARITRDFTPPPQSTSHVQSLSTSTMRSSMRSTMRLGANQSLLKSVFQPGSLIPSPRSNFAVSRGSFYSPSTMDDARASYNDFEVPLADETFQTDGVLETEQGEVIILGEEYDHFANTLEEYKQVTDPAEVLNPENGEAAGLAETMAEICERRMADIAREVEIDVNSHDPEEHALWEAERNTWWLLQRIYGNRIRFQQEGEKLRLEYPSEFKSEMLSDDADTEISSTEDMEIDADEKESTDSETDTDSDAIITSADEQDNNPRRKTKREGKRKPKMKGNHDIYDDLREKILQETHAFASEKDIVGRMLEMDGDIRENMTVKYWLEEIASPFEPIEVRRGYRSHTKQMAHKATYMGSHITADKQGNLVRSLDPDAPEREGRNLAIDDENYERGLARTLFEYARRGQFDRAEALCKQSDQPWRAASIRGGRFYHTGILAKTRSMLDDDDEDTPFPRGNKNRELWKGTCYCLSSDENMDAYERALYGSLCGDYKTVLNVSETWHDHVWAYYTAMIESQLSEGIKKYSKRPAAKSELDLPSGGQDLSPQSIFDGMFKSDRMDIRKCGEFPFNRIQAYIIMDEMDDLIRYVKEKLETSGWAYSPTMNPSVCRFMAHLVLYLRQIDVDFPQEDGDKILVLYLDTLIHARKNNIIAQYAARLPPGQQTEVYARFLKGIMEPVENRRYYLELARAQDLDVWSICDRTAEIIFAENTDPFERESFLSETAVIMTPLDDLVDPADLVRIRALEWLTMDPSQYAKTLISLNELTRKFMVVGKMNALHTLYRRHIPDDIAVVLEEQSRISLGEDGEMIPEGVKQSPVDWKAVDYARAEYLCYLDFLKGLELYREWSEVFYRKPVQGIVDGQRLQPSVEDWLRHFTTITEKTEESLRTMLTKDWLGAPLRNMWSKEDVNSEREKQLNRLRKIYIPEITFRLHSVLYESRGFVLGNLTKSLELAVLIADQKTMLFREFQHSNQLSRLCEMFRRSAVESLGYEEANPLHVQK